MAETRVAVPSIVWGPIHFYHCYAAGPGWREAVEDHTAALRESEFSGAVILTAIGDSRGRKEALRVFEDGFPIVGLIEAEKGWEQVTLEVMRANVGQYDCPILYAHSKGAANPTPLNILWRRSMTKHVIREWEFCRDKLSFEDYDAVGCHWLTHAEYPMNASSMADGFFGGNFWMATSTYIASLPPCSLDNRWEAEAWVGLNKPRIYDLLEGWPSQAVFARGGTR